MTQSNHIFSCYLIGETFLLSHCAALLLKKKHQILGVITSNPSLKKWAEDEKIPLVSDLKKIESTLSAQPFDYLFSIVNKVVLPEKILKLPKKLAINFHDSLLPKYAGVNVTSWALMNHEKEHGITWHVMEEGIDTGAILKQVKIPISSEDTAFTLNAACFEAASESFEDLVDELSEGKSQSRPQNFEQRTYYPFGKKPKRLGLINFHESAEQIEVLYRALDFGFYENPLVLPKAFIDNRVQLVSNLKIKRVNHQAQPGEILHLNQSQISVACRDGTVEFETPELGKDLRINLKKGQVFQVLDKKLMDLIDEFNRETGRFEGYWKRKLSVFQPTRLSSLEDLECQDGNTIDEMALEDVCGELENKFTENRRVLFLALFCLYCSRMSESESVDLGFSPENVQDYPEEFFQFYSRQVPWSITFDERETFGDVCKKVNLELSQVNAKRSFLRDLFWRYPDLKTKQFQWQKPLPIGITFTSQNSSDYQKEISPFHLFIYSEGKKSRVRSDFTLSHQIQRVLNDLKGLAVSIADSPCREIRGLDILPAANSVWEF